MRMSDAEAEAFLSQTSPTPLGVVGTLRDDGSPHVVPLWFRWAAGVATIWSGESRSWVQNLMHDPRAAFSVDSFNRPYAAVMMRGHATVRTADDEATIAEAQAICRRYLAPEKVEDYVASWPNLRTIVTITPEHFMSATGG